MNQYDLSILIPARNEDYLAETVKNILENKRGNTEILVGLDGAWANPGIPDHPDVTVVYYPQSIGQRALTNQLCKLSQAKWVMKLDAHCALDEGFDVKLLAKTEDDWTIIPALYNLHCFNWKCNKCGNEWYQGAQPKHCQLPNTDGNKPEHINPKCDSTSFKKEIVFKPRLNKRSEFYRFDTNLHFQYHGARKNQPDSAGDIAETMSAQGSCFMLTRKKYWELNICDETFGSWGQQGVEVACKTWLSGGRLVVNKTTWYSHLFRTQEGFGFPYPQSQSQIEQARAYSKKLFLDNTWEGQIYPLLWLIDKFKPLTNKGNHQAPDWHTEEGKEVYEYLIKKADEFWGKGTMKDTPLLNEDSPGGFLYNLATQIKEGAEDAGAVAEDTFYLDDVPHSISELTTPTKAAIYYTDNQLNIKIAHAVQDRLAKISFDRQMPIISASLKPMKFGKNIYLPLPRGYLTMAKQILAALEACEADIVYFCEHDVLYDPSHFDFTPLQKDIYYYNTNVWRVRISDGHALYTDNLQQLSGLVAYRDTLITHYKKRIIMLEGALIIKDPVDFNSYVRAMGFEPGTHNRSERIDDLKAESFQSKSPNLDLRHDKNLTPSRWNPDQFRNKKYTQGWKEDNFSKQIGSLLALK
jgi:glycosyltransferase involved in cell wall biosynthesis